MQKLFRKPLAVLLSLVMVFTALSAGFVIPAFAVDTTALDAAVADANALTAADYVDFSGVTSAVAAAEDALLDLSAYTQEDIDDLTSSVHLSMKRLVANPVSTSHSVSVTGSQNWTNVAAGTCRLTTYGADEVTADYTYNNSNAVQVRTMSDDLAPVATYYYDVNSIHTFADLSAARGFKLRYTVVNRTYADVWNYYIVTNNSAYTSTAPSNVNLSGKSNGYYEDRTINGTLPSVAGQEQTVLLTCYTSMAQASTFSASTYILCLTKLKLHLVPFDKTALFNAISLEISPESKYTADSFATYISALEAAVQVCGKAIVTQEEIDAATTALNNAINGLQTTITLDGNSGTVSPDVLTVTMGSASSVAFSENSVTKTRAGYDFAGWDKDTVTFNDTVTAQWTARTDTAYTVNHYYMDATGSYDVEPVSEDKTGTTDTSAVFADLISVPAHFTYDAETTGATSANIDGTGDAVINLYYARDQYTVSFVSGATGETLDTQTVYYEADATEPEAPEYVEKDAAGHFKFTGWDEDFTNITGDLTVTALYEEEGHDFGAFAFADEDNHERTCANCDYVETESHNYLFDSFVWSDDNTSAQVKLICEHCDDEKLVDAAMSEDAHAAECEKDAYTVYTATYGDESDSKTVTAEGTALEHNYLFDSFVWSDDNTTAQAKLICERCGDEKLVAAEMSEDVHAAECEKDAYTVYTATYGDETDSKTVTAEGTALEHNYLFDSFVWSADNTSAQAKLICEHCDDEKLVDAAMSEDAHAAECEKDAYTVYTATYGDETDSKTVTAEGTALEHNYLFNSFVWSADNTSAQAKLICEHCGDEKLVAAEMSEDAHAAACEQDAYTIYTATYGGETDSKTVTAEGTALAHSFIYTSNGDGTHAVTCANCDYSASADCEYDETSHAATCVEGAYITYTCKDCGYTYDGEKGEPDPSNHVGVIHTVGAVAATATEDGYTGDKVCSACGETVETGTVIPAGSETPDEPDTPDAPDTPADGETEGFHCAYCGKVHPKTFTGWIIYIFHMLAAIIRSLTPVAAGAARL